ncbi:MAG: hypothetical protein WAT70_14810, partial [Rhizobiaceae bacterium]
DPALVSRPGACTGCGICVPCCEPGAITITQLDQGGPLRIALESATCSACGARFHSPHKVQAARGRCRICTRVDHRAKLFQVLE